MYNSGIKKMKQADRATGIDEKLELYEEAIHLFENVDGLYDANAYASICKSTIDSLLREKE